MASDGTRVFVLGGYLEGARAGETSLIHVFDTSMYFRFLLLSGQFPKIENTENVKYPEPERNAVNPNEKTTQQAGKSFTGPATVEQPQHAISSTEGEVSSLELERQLSVLLAAQTERDQRIAQLTALLEQAEANAAEAAKRAGLHADRLLMQTSLVEQRDAELVDLQARFNGLVLSASIYLILIFDSQFYST